MVCTLLVKYHLLFTPSCLLHKWSKILLDVEPIRFLTVDEKLNLFHLWSFDDGAIRPNL